MKALLDCTTSKLLAQGAAWRLASLLLERPRSGWRGEVDRVSSEVSDQRLTACARESRQGTEEIYHRLFGPGGAVSPREVSYCRFEDPGRLMADLNSFYQAFSYTPRRDEPIDHISVETGFVGYLFLKEAYANMRGAAASVEVTQKARVRFLDEHVNRCAAGMIDLLGDNPLYLKNVLSWITAKETTDRNSISPKIG